MSNEFSNFQFILKSESINSIQDDYIKQRFDIINSNELSEEKISKLDKLFKSYCNQISNLFK